MPKLSKNMVLEAQERWAQGITAIGQAPKHDKRDVTSRFLDELYTFQEGNVLFKPTLANECPFRLSKEAALSYFIGGNPEFPEDKGFALRPWRKVVFENSKIVIDGSIGLAMGHYFFIDATNDRDTRVEFSFCYKLTSSGQVKIILHHSSLPQVKHQKEVKDQKAC